MKETIEVTRYICDACGMCRDEAAAGDLVNGLYGDVYEVTAIHGGGAEWWACSRKCVGKAIANALDRDDDR